MDLVIYKYKLIYGLRELVIRIDEVRCIFYYM